MIKELKIEKRIEERQLSQLKYPHRMKNDGIARDIYESRTKGRNKVEETCQKVAESPTIN